MSVSISGVEPGSIGEKSGMRAGDELLAINGRPIRDVLDYRFHMTGRHLKLLVRRGGEEKPLTLRKGEYDDLGLLFDTYLMDKQRSCKNKCVFCFIDQMPPGMRHSLYFKDDDARMSFLFGNYITLTNLQEDDVRRILEMHISPVNVSVHTTNPQLRVEMMKNPHAGKALDYLPRLAAGGIKINAQLVLCPGINDGAELHRSLADLSQLGENLQSVSGVPVGLTKYREGLPDLRLFTPPEALAVLETMEAAGEEMLARHGSRVFFAADEFYLCAGQPIPPSSYYEDFYQLENGVGLLALLEEEFHAALRFEEARPVNRRVTVATGVAAAPFLTALARDAMDKFPGLQVAVVPIRNDFFGETITVAGLVCARDLIAQLKGKSLGEELLFPAAMLRREGDLFLDGLTPEDVSRELDVPVKATANDGGELLDALLGQPVD